MRRVRIPHRAYSQYQDFLRHRRLYPKGFSGPLFFPMLHLLLKMSYMSVAQCGLKVLQNTFVFLSYIFDAEMRIFRGGFLRESLNIQAEINPIQIQRRVAYHIRVLFYKGYRLMRKNGKSRIEIRLVCVNTDGLFSILPLFFRASLRSSRLRA